MLVKNLRSRVIRSHFSSKTPGNHEGYFLSRKNRFIDSDDVNKEKEIKKSDILKQESKQRKRDKLKRLGLMIENAGV